LQKKLTAKRMEQIQQNGQNRKEKTYSELLRQSIINQSYDPAVLWGRAADSFPQNKRKHRIRIAIAIVIGVIIGALAMNFLSSPERWIRL
jgi:hypothetical protein